MSWQSDLGGLFEDLEQQAEGMVQEERDAELADRSAAEYAHVAWAARVHASLGRVVGLSLLGARTAQGTVLRAGRDWVLLGPPEELVRLGAVRTATGLSPRATAERARPAAARLGFGSAVRTVAERGPVLLDLVDGSRLRALVLRVGADFVETDAGVVPFEAVAALRPSAP